MTRPRLISRIYDHAYGPAPTGVDAQERNHAARVEAWQRLAIAVIDPADIDDDWLRLAVRNWADKRYGQRKGRG